MTVLNSEKRIDRDDPTGFLSSFRTVQTKCKMQKLSYETMNTGNTDHRNGQASRKEMLGLEPVFDVKCKKTIVLAWITNLSHFVAREG